MSIFDQPLQAPAKEDRWFSDRPGLLGALGFAPLLTVFFINLWGRPHYQFFPLALAGAGFLAWSRRQAVVRPFSPGQPMWTVLLVAGSFCGLVGATVLWSPWVGTIAAFIGLVGITWQVGGGVLLRALLPALLLVLTIIPPPLAADTRLIQHLRVLAVTWSSHFLDLLGVTHALAGNVIELPGQKLLVDEACSGINSVLITLAGCLFYGLWRRRSAVYILICLGSSLAFVLLGNVVRITLGAWLGFSYHIDILSGRVHELVGLVLLLSYLTMIVSLDQLLAFLTAPSRSRTLSRPPAPAAPPVAKVPARAQIPGVWLRAAAGAFALLGLVDLGLGALRYQQQKILAAAPVAPASHLRAGAKFTLPEQIGRWQRLSPEVSMLHKIETMGVLSQSWHYQQGDLQVAVALDYPFQGHHDLKICYELCGWEMVGQQFQGGRGTNRSPPFTEVRMRNQLSQQGTFWLSSVNERGEWKVGPPLKPGMKSGMVERLRSLAFQDASATYQIQVLWTGFNPLAPAEEEQVRQFYQAARQMLWRQLSAQMQEAK